MTPRRTALQYFFPWELLEMKTIRPLLRPAGSTLGMDQSLFQDVLGEILKATHSKAQQKLWDAAFPAWPLGGSVAQDRLVREGSRASDDGMDATLRWMRDVSYLLLQFISK